jgi:CheY-like chemotaxis protein
VASYRVIVAEDNELLCELMAQQLAEIGCQVVGTATNGVEAVELVARERPDVALIDRGLPVQDGLAASRAIAAATPVAVILLSAYVSRHDPEKEARAAGAHGFLSKPFLIEELEQAVWRAVRCFQAANGA